MSLDLERHWISFLRESLVQKQFPRDMYRSRILVTDPTQYIRELRKNFTSTDCFIGHYSHWQLAENIFDCVFIENDNPTMEVAKDVGWENQKILLDLEWPFRLFFSGRRGFHMHIAHPPIKLKVPKLTMLTFCKSLRFNMDEVIRGNIAQLVRVAYTQHSKTKLFSFELPYDIPLKDLDLAQLFHHALKPVGDLSGVIIPCQGVADRLLELDDKLKDRKVTYNVEANGRSKEGPFPPCILHLLDRLKSEGVLSHSGRLHLTAYLFRRGYSIDEVLRLYAENAGDFKEAQTKYQLNKINEGKMLCYGCVKLVGTSTCPFIEEDARKCSFYPSINLVEGFFQDA